MDLIRIWVEHHRDMVLVQKKRQESQLGTPFIATVRVFVSRLVRLVVVWRRPVASSLPGRGSGRGTPRPTRTPRDRDPSVAHGVVFGGGGRSGGPVLPADRGPHGRMFGVAGCRGDRFGPSRVPACDGSAGRIYVYRGLLTQVGGKCVHEKGV